MYTNRFEKDFVNNYENSKSTVANVTCVPCTYASECDHYLDEQNNTMCMLGERAACVDYKGTTLCTCVVAKPHTQR